MMQSLSRNHRQHCYTHKRNNLELLQYPINSRTSQWTPLGLTNAVLN
jgi:hypothetical protein